MTQVQTERPKVPTVYVALTDPHTGERKHRTLYFASIEEVERRLVGEPSAEVVASRRPARRRQPAGA